jgi:hypothetical protein
MTIKQLVNESYPELPEGDRSELAFQAALWLEVPMGDNHYTLRQSEVEPCLRFVARLMRTEEQ